jgi:glucuronide carrier protein
MLFAIGPDPETEGTCTALWGHPFFQELLMADKLKKSVLYTYGIADMFFMLIVGMEMFYFTAFLTDYAQFSMTGAAIILWVTGAFDMVCALIAGVILQKVTLRFGGKYRSWFLIGPALFVPFFILQFSRIGNDLLAAFIIIAGFVISHLLWNVVFTASGAMVGRLSQLPDEITVLSTNRAQGTSAAGLIFSLTGWPMIGFFGAYTNKVAGFTSAAAIYSIFVILGYWYVYKITAGKDPYDEKTVDISQNESGLSIKEIVGLVFRNPPLLSLIVAEIFRFACASIVMAFAYYYFRYVIRNSDRISVFLLATSVAGLLGALAATWVGIRFGKRKVYWISLVLGAAASASAKSLGYTLWGFVAVCCLVTFLGVVAGSMSTALFSDTVVYGEWKTGKNIRAFTMALLNFPIKLGILIRSAVVTFGLAAIGFASNAVPSLGVTDGIISIMTLIPAAACILAAAFFYFGYKIEEHQVLRMQEEIAAKKVMQPVC